MNIIKFVTNCHTMIINGFVFCCRRSSGRSSRKFRKMYGIMPCISNDQQISPAADFTVTTVTNFCNSFISILNIIKLLIVTEIKKSQKKSHSVTNCHKLLQTVTNCYTILSHDIIIMNIILI